MNDEKYKDYSFTNTLQNYTSGNTTTQTNNEESLNLAARIKTNQAQKTLNEMGLQNVYDTYDKQTKELARQKQISQEDAVFVREMSKKYLGEYASNLGIGDVSGNLLDVHSKYQENLRAIDEGFQSSSFALDNAYQEARMGHLNEIFKAQLGVEIAQAGVHTQNVLKNIITGQFPEGMDAFSYLESEKDNIDVEEYNVIYGDLYSQMLNEIQEAFINNYYGMERNQEGALSPVSDFEQYLSGERFKNLSTRDRNTFREANEFRKYIEQQISTKNIANKFTVNEQGERIENPDYIGDNYNYELMTGESAKNLALGTTAFVDSTGTRRFGVTEPIDNEKKYQTDTIEITEEYKLQNEDELPNEGSIIDLVINVDGSGEKTSFVFFGGKWHRLINEKTYSTAEMAFWNPNTKTLPAGVKKVKQDSITINGEKYKKDERLPNQYKLDDSSKVSNTKLYDNVRNTFIGIYGKEQNVPEHAFAVYNGALYKWEKGDIYTTRK